MGRPDAAALILLLVGLAGPAHGGISPEVRQALLQRDFLGAAADLEAAADRGDADGDMLYELARLYDRGLGVPRDRRRSYEYFRQAAGLGHIESTYLVGVMTEQGRGTAPDPSAARVWYERAVSMGHGLAQQRLSAIAEQGGPGSLTEALRRADPAAARRLATRDAVQTAAAQGSAPLFAAVDIGDATLVELLVEAGADPMEADGVGRLPLHHAAASGQLEICRVLVAAGTPLDFRDSAGNSALHLAISNGRAELVAWLLRQGADRQLANADGWTPRMLASRSADIRLTKLFDLDAGSPGPRAGRHAQLQQAAAERGWSKLALAAWTGEMTLVEQLLTQGADPDAVDGSGRTALYRALSAGHADVAMLLLDRGARVTASPGTANVLHLVAEHGPDALLPRLAAHSELLDARDERGNTPLLLAADGARERAVRLLIEAGADVRVSNSQGTSALHLLARQRQPELIDLLVAVGALVNAQDGAGRTPLWWAVRAEQPGAVERLLHHGGDLRGADGGVTPLHVAADLPGPEMLERLLAAGGSVDVRSDTGATPLLVAANGGRIEAVRNLVDAGAEVDARNAFGDTPLICAVRGGYKGVARYLLARGASPRSRNERHQSARDLAEAHGDPEWVAMFQGHSVIGLLQRSVERKE